jgi:hypothetical protein
MGERASYRPWRSLGGDLAALTAIFACNCRQSQPTKLREANIKEYLVKPVRQSRLFDCLVNVMGNSVD